MVSIIKNNVSGCMWTWVYSVFTAFQRNICLKNRDATRFEERLLYLECFSYTCSGTISVKVSPLQPLKAARGHATCIDGEVLSITPQGHNTIKP